jgi:hypothetical protein
MKLWKKRSYGILYLAFHGFRGGISLDDGTSVNLKQLASLIGHSFNGRTVHFGSCETLNTRRKDIENFLANTGVSLVTGYVKEINWAESAALDLLLFDWLQRGEDMKKFQSKYRELIKINGLRVFPL